MKFVCLAGIALGAAFWMLPGADAQVSICRSTAFAYDAYYHGEDDVESPSDKPWGKIDDRAPKVDSRDGERSDDDAGCGCSACADCAQGVPAVASECCQDGSPSEVEDCGEPWTLQRCENDLRIEYGGWISGGVTVNDQGNTSSIGNFPIAYRNDPHLNLDQLWGFMGRTADTGGCGWDWGFRLDFVYGVDGPDNQAFGDVGWDNSWGGNANAPGNQYGAAMPQWYAEVAYNDWTLKLGHFFTIIGYEVVEAPRNAFYSHSYQLYYAEPLSHTGFLLSYALDDHWSLVGGFTYGWDSGFNNANDAATFLGGVTWTSDDEKTSIAYAVSAGRFGNGSVDNAGDLYMHSVVFSQEFDDSWTLVLQHDLGTNTGLAAADNEWYGLGVYLIKRFNCCWSAGGRIEWFRDDDGARVGAAGIASGSYYDLTLGLNWEPHTNIKVRPEVRYDWFDGGPGAPFDPVGGVGTQDDQLTAGLDVILTF